jgi:hypothetical protein
MGLKVFVGEWYFDRDSKIDKRIMSQIKKSDCIIILLTKDGLRSNWVQLEVEHAIREKKPLIPLVEKGIEKEKLVSLQGRRYIEYDPLQPQQGLKDTLTYLKSLRLKGKRQEKTTLIASGIVAFLLLLSGVEK